MNIDLKGNNCELPANKKMAFFKPKIASIILVIRSFAMLFSFHTRTYNFYKSYFLCNIHFSKRVLTKIYARR